MRRWTATALLACLAGCTGRAFTTATQGSATAGSGSEQALSADAGPSGAGGSSPSARTPGATGGAAPTAGTGQLWEESPSVGGATATAGSSATGGAPSATGGAEPTAGSSPSSRIRACSTATGSEFRVDVSADGMSAGERLTVDYAVPFTAGRDGWIVELLYSSGHEPSVALESETVRATCVARGTTAVMQWRLYRADWSSFESHADPAWDGCDG